MPKRGDILRSYRELLYLIKRLPCNRQAAALEEARHRLKSAKAVSNELTASDLHKELVGRIGFLRMTTPRHATDRYAKAGIFVLREGSLVEGRAERESRSADGKMPLEEARQKHHELLKRQHFGREPPRIRQPF